MVSFDRLAGLRLEIYFALRSTGCSLSNYDSSATTKLILLQYGKDVFEKLLCIISIHKEDGLATA